MIRTNYSRQRAAVVTRSSITQDWLDVFYALCLASDQLAGHRVEEEVALRMCRSGYSPADALARYLILNVRVPS